MLKALRNLLLCVALASCGHSSVSTSQAYGLCHDRGYGYDGYDAVPFKDCTEYLIEAGKHKDKSPSPAEFYCKRANIKPDDDGYADCITEKTTMTAEYDRKAAAYVKVMEKEQAEAAKRAEQERIAQQKQAEKERQEAIARQKAADTQQCQEYGFKKGTDKMAECIMKLQQARVAAAQQALMQAAAMQQQAAIAQQQAAIAQQQTQAIINQTIQQQYNATRPVTCNRFGATTTCY